MGTRANLQVKDERLGQALRGERYLVIDGAMGSMLLQRGIEEANKHPELLNLTNPQVVTEIHRAYTEAGADIATLNTFGANARKLAGAASVEELFVAGAACAREAGASYIAGDIGPIGALMAPYGDLSFDEAYELFAQAVKAGVAAGCDLFIIETMTDLQEAKAAVLAVTENSDLPLIATMTFDENARTLMGSTPAVAACTLAQLGADVVGMNCSLGPDQVKDIARELNESSPVPVAVQPNAGLPVTVDGVAHYEVTADEFVESYRDILASGTRFLGSCCGSEPDFTRGLSGLVEGKFPGELGAGYGPCATSSRSFVRLGAGAERVPGSAEVVNPEGGADVAAVFKGVKRCKAELPAIELADFSPEEAAALAGKLLGYAKKPVWLKGADPAVLEPLVRPYAGCPVVGDGSGADAASEELRAFAARYGCALV